MLKFPENFRLNQGVFRSEPGRSGAFLIPAKSIRAQLCVIASNEEGWEHVSVHVMRGPKTETPDWELMCTVKAMFWEAEDVVIQYHPAKSQYVNHHPNTLHLWRPIGQTIPTPPKILV